MKQWHTHVISILWQNISHFLKSPHRSTASLIQYLLKVCLMSKIWQYFYIECAFSTLNSNKTPAVGLHSYFSIKWSPLIENKQKEKQSKHDHIVRWVNKNSDFFFSFFKSGLCSVNRKQVSRDCYGNLQHWRRRVLLWQPHAKQSQLHSLPTMLQLCPALTEGNSWSSEKPFLLFAVLGSYFIFQIWLEILFHSWVLTK